MNKGQVGIGTLILLFIGIIIVVALLPAIASNISELKDKQTITDETVDFSSARLAGGTINSSVEFSVSNAPTGWDIEHCPLTSVTLSNSSGTDWTTSTDYVFTTAHGNFTLKNTVAVNGSSTNNTLVDYTFCPEGYASTGGARAMAGIILVFAALGLLGFAVYYSVRQFF